MYEIRSALEGDKRQKAADLAHGLISAAGQVGAESLRLLSQSVEQRLKEGRDVQEADLAILEKEFGGVRFFLQRYLEEVS